MTNISLTPAETLGFSILIVWSIFWKGLALWKSARENDKVWFIVLLIINTAGLLEILYIFVFSKRQQAAKNAD